MQAVKDWVYMLLISSVIGSVLIYIVPEGGMNKYVKFVAGICAAGIAVVPIVSAVKQVPEADINVTVPVAVQYGDNIGNELIVRETVFMLKNETRQMIYEKTSINPTEIYIYIERAENYISTEDNGDNILIIKSAKVVLKDEDMPRSEEVYICMQAFLDCEVEVTAEWEGSSLTDNVKG